MTVAEHSVVGPFCFVCAVGLQKNPATECPATVCLVTVCLVTVCLVTVCLVTVLHDSRSREFCESRNPRLGEFSFTQSAIDTESVERRSLES